jgi:hypothetical protein
VPKTSSRRFLNLLTAFGVKGGGDDLRFPLSGSIAPTIDADKYDPGPLYAVAQFVAPVAAQFAALEIKPRAHMRIVALGTQFDDWVILSRQDFSAGSVAIPTQTLYSSDGTLPDVEVRRDNNAAVQLGADLNATKFPALQSVHLEAGRVVRFQGLTVAGAGLKVTVWFQTPTRTMS